MILKGFIIGIGKILPGVSGALLAFSLGIYDKCIYILSNLRKELLTNIKFLLSLIFGIILAILLGSRIINYLLNNFYVPTIFLFIGLMIGSFKTVTSQVKFNIRYVLISLLGFTLLMSIGFIKSVANIDSYLLLGLIEAISMIIPGISGTAIMIILGNYDNMLDLLINPFKCELLIFLIGLFIGIILISKLMNFLLNKYKEIIYHLIYGFLFSSIFNLYMSIMNNAISIIMYIVSIVLLIIGYYISKYISSV